ncbi:MAG: hypothetical protein ACREN5_13830 [Gemmatimonadales bacterium]
MKMGTTITGVLAVLLAGCAQESAAPPGAARPDSAQSDGTRKAQGTTERGTVAPQPGEGPPHPGVSHEERERILRGTERPAAGGQSPDR